LYISDEGDNLAGRDVKGKIPQYIQLTESDIRHRQSTSHWSLINISWSLIHHLLSLISKGIPLDPEIFSSDLSVNKSDNNSTPKMTKPPAKKATQKKPTAKKNEDKTPPHSGPTIKKNISLS
ncbi:hypothetical protein PTTG_30018, partial [Puccinia triticina 1-1 BBBD Race 1]